jgi:plastocyanin
MTPHPTSPTRERLRQGSRKASRRKLPVAILAVLGMLTALASAGSAGAETVEVTTSGLTFAPDAVTIDVGDSVHFTGLFFHNVAESDCPNTVSSVWNGGFRSGGTSAVLEWTYVFDEPGTYCYICEPHIGDLMVGTVTVQAAVPSLSGKVGILAVAMLALVGLAFLYRQNLQKQATGH